MTESLLLTFHKNVYSKKLDYCVVCLRTSGERRLSKPYYVKMFASAINQPLKFNDPNHMACYICERQAATAWRFLKASSRASFAINVMATLGKSTKKREMIRTLTADKKHEEWLSSVLECESEMVQQRARSQLLLTEVLVVGSPIPMPDSTNPVPTEDTPVVSMGHTHIPCLGESRDLYVVPDDIPRERVSESWELTQKPEEGMTSVIIYDEEDDPININTDIQHTNNPIALANDHISDKINPLSFNTKKSTDMLGKILENPRIGEMSMLTHNTIYETAPTQLMLHPIIFNSGMMTVPSLSANIVNGILVTNNYNSLNSLGTPQLALQNGLNLDFISDPDKVTNVLRVLSHQDAGKVHIFTGAVPISSAGSSTNVQIAPQTLFNGNKDGWISMPNLGSTTIPPLIAVCNPYDPLFSKNPAPNKNSSPPKNIPTGSKYSSTSKNPSGSKNPPGSKTPPVGQQGSALLRTDRIDWEDKIPMDVISLVDKNDTITKRPRYSNTPMPLGISDVVSLNNEEVIIDLC